MEIVKHMFLEMFLFIIVAAALIGFILGNLTSSIFKVNKLKVEQELKPDGIELIITEDNVVDTLYVYDINKY